MFARIKPTLESLLPWKKASDRVTELKPWVRVAVTTYVLTVVPLLLFMFGLMVINTPRILSTAYDSFFVQYHKVQHAFDGGSALTGAIGIFQMLILLLPAIGIVATFWMVLRRISGTTWKRTEGHPAARGVLLLASAAAATLVGYLWWPNGDYRPIQVGEKGTIQGAVKQFTAVPNGRPALTQRREGELGGAPLESSRQNIAKPVLNDSTDQTRTPTTETTTIPSDTATIPSDTLTTPTATVDTVSTAATTGTTTTTTTTETATTPTTTTTP
jgi:hypothetical protein